MARRFLNAYSDWYQGSVLRAHLNARPRADGYPHSNVKRVAAARSLPDADDPAPTLFTGVRGESPHPRMTRGKTLTYELRQRALTEPDLIASTDALEAAFSDLSSIGTLVLTPWPGHGSDIWATYAQVAAYDCDEQLVYIPGQQNWPDTDWMYDPVLSLRQTDGRWLRWNESGSPGTAMTFAGSPGAQNVSVLNSGTAPTDPVVTVASVAAGTDVHIGRDTATGSDGISYLTRSLWFRGLPAGMLTVDFTKRKASVGSTDVTDLLDVPNSDWWDAGADGVPPGTFNLWRGPGAGGDITVSFFSASW